MIAWLAANYGWILAIFFFCSACTIVGTWFAGRAQREHELTDEDRRRLRDWYSRGACARARDAQISDRAYDDIH